MAPDPVDEFELLADERARTMRVQRSEFVAFAFPASTEEALKEHLDDIGREHHASRHLCWGHRFLGSDWSLIEKSSDAGEPSGTAGQPILNAIRGAGLVDSAVVVVRYFGGVKLGTGGLVRAYGDSAAAVLDGAPRKRRLRRSNVEISTSFSAMNGNLPAR